MVIVSHETHYAALYIYEEHVVQYLDSISPTFFQDLATFNVLHCIIDFRFDITCVMVISFYVSIISIKRASFFIIISYIGHVWLTSASHPSHLRIVCAMDNTLVTHVYTYALVTDPINDLWHFTVDPTMQQSHSRTSARNRLDSTFIGVLIRFNGRCSEIHWIRLKKTIILTIANYWKSGLWFQSSHFHVVNRDSRSVDITGNTDITVTAQCNRATHSHC